MLIKRYALILLGCPIFAAATFSAEDLKKSQPSYPYYRSQALRALYYYEIVGSDGERMEILPDYDGSGYDAGMLLFSSCLDSQFIWVD